MWWGIAAAAVLGWLVWAERRRELFYVSFRDGKLLLVRGRIPQALFNDFAEALRRQNIDRASVKAVRRPHAMELHIGGWLDDFQAQRLRNIFRLYPQSNLTAAPVLTQRTMGQLLGIAWLAWLLDSR